jgi:hypothetical protein
LEVAVTRLSLSLVILIFIPPGWTKMTMKRERERTATLAK